VTDPFAVLTYLTAAVDETAKTVGPPMHTDGRRLKEDPKVDLDLIGVDRRASAAAFFRMFR
jgi:hypothetical protein